MQKLPKAAALLNKLQQNPVWAAKVFLQQKHVWSKQREILWSVWKNRYTIVKSTTGTGKTYASALALVLFAHLFRPSINVVIAPRWKIINEQVFEEIRNLYSSNPYLMGRIKESPHLKLGHKHFITGFSSQGTKDASIRDLLTGLHSPHQFNVLDQACGLTPEVYEAILGLMDSDHARCLIISNPYNKNSEFGRIWAGKSRIIKDAYRISINAFDNPNVVNKRTVITGLSTYQKFAEMTKNWSKDDPLYRLHVLGEFIDDMEKILIPTHLFEKLQLCQDQPDFGNVNIGLDVADEGVDKTVWVVTAGNRTLMVKTYSGSGLQKIYQLTVDLLLYLVENFHQIPSIYDININVDSTPTGKSVFEMLFEAGYRSHKIKTGRKPPPVLGTDAVEDYINFRAYLGFLLRTRAYNTDFNIIPMYGNNQDGVLSALREESAIKYEHNQSGKLKLMLKEKFKLEIGRSPDYFDAYCLAIIPPIDTLFTYFDSHREENILGGGLSVFDGEDESYDDRRKYLLTQYMRE